MANLPEWMPESLWAEFKKHRQRIRAPMTDYAGTLILCKLEKFKIAGANPIDVLNESIERGWAGVFLNGHASAKETTTSVQMDPKKLRCRSCGNENWISLSSGKCERCR